MKAVILKEFGGVENLVQAEIPEPLIGDNELLVKVVAAAVNPVDIKTRKGRGLALSLKQYQPVILGWDISGIVVRRGRSVTAFKKGDEVFGTINFPGHGRAYAEYVAAQEDHLALKPANISHNEAAGASLAALTAWQILKDRLRIKNGDRILIHAAAGGVGHFAVQMAAWLGAVVAVTSSGESKDFVMSLGASTHVDYTTQPFEDLIREQDFVLDPIGGEYIDRSLNTLKHGGTIVSISSGDSEDVAEKARARGMSGYLFSVRSSGKNMKEISELLRKGAVRSHISKTFSFEEVRSAHLQIETKKTRGKIVLTV